MLSRRRRQRPFFFPSSPVGGSDIHHFATSMILMVMILLTMTVTMTMTTALGPLLTSGQHRAEVLNLLNHPLQLQLATGELPLESFRRLVTDRETILEGIREATAAGAEPLVGIRSADNDDDDDDNAPRGWLRAAEAHHAGLVAGTTTGTGDTGGSGNDEEDDGASQAASALASVLRSSGPAGAAAVLRCYGFACDRLLVARAAATASAAVSTEEPANPGYDGWLRAHAEGWSALADRCEAALLGNEAAPPTEADRAAASLCLSLLYNWIDGEAATTGIRGDLGKDPRLSGLMDALEDLEPGYAAQRDKHASFVAGVTGTTPAAASSSAPGGGKTAAEKAAAAAAYLAAKRDGPKSPAAKKAEAYLAARRKTRAAEAYLAAKRKKATAKKPEGR